MKIFRFFDEVTGIAAMIIANTKEQAIIEWDLIFSVHSKLILDKG